MEAEAIKAFYFRELDIPEAPLLVDPQKSPPKCQLPEFSQDLSFPLWEHECLAQVSHIRALSFLLPDLQGVIAIMDWFDLGGMSR